VPAEHQRSAAASTFEDTNDVRASRGHVRDLDDKPQAAEFVGQAPGDFGFTAGSGHQRGIHRVNRDEIPKQGDRRVSSRFHVFQVRGFGTLR
jgi:hypothetical protein